MSARCSFCQHAVGESPHDLQRRALSSIQDSIPPDDFQRMKANLESMPEKKVRLVLPGPGNLFICDRCIDLYAEAAHRELERQE